MERTYFNLIKNQSFCIGQVDMIKLQQYKNDIIFHYKQC